MKGTQKQKQALRYLTDASTKEVAFGGAAGGGKSYLGSFWLLVMSKSYPGSRWFIAREELKRIRQSTLITFHKLCRSLDVDDYHVNHNDNYIEFENGSRIDMLDVKYLPGDPLFERFGSTEYTGGWIEEGGETNFGAYEVLKSRTGRHMNLEYGLIGKLLVTCNPKKNWLYSTFYKPWKENRLPDKVKYIPSLVGDNPNLPEDYIDNLRGLKDKAKRERLLLGNWEYDDDPNALCSYENILGLFENDHVPEGDSYLTADVARKGSDKAIIVVWKGWRAVDITVFDISSTVDIQNCINAKRTEHGIPKNKCIADEDGVGGGVVDNTGIKGFVNNSTPVKIFVEGRSRPENYKNLQTQCGYLLAEKVEQGAMYIAAEVQPSHREEIVEDFEQLKRHNSDSDGKLELLPKKMIKEMLGRSPDWRDVFLMRCYFDISPYTGVYY